jgi:hypothetical protein
MRSRPDRRSIFDRKLHIALAGDFWYFAPTPPGPDFVPLTEQESVATEEDFPWLFAVLAVPRLQMV